MQTYTNKNIISNIIRKQEQTIKGIKIVNYIENQAHMVLI